jgi:membrane-associated phospholipid phosphatase
MHLHRRLLLIGIACGVAAAVLAVYVAGHPYIPEDAVVERDIQATQWGPLALTFPIFSWIGDAKGAVLEAIVFVLVLLVNRRAWLVAAGAVLSGAWYELGIHLVNRPRPTTAQVLQVTEHPGASSFPSGHTIFIVTITTVVLLCLGYRFLPRWGRVVGWAVVGAIVVANGIGRIYTGAHWPTDVLGGLLIATAWLCIWVSVGRVSDAALGRENEQSRERGDAGAVRRGSESRGGAAPG